MGELPAAHIINPPFSVRARSDVKEECCSIWSSHTFNNLLSSSPAPLLSISNKRRHVFFFSDGVQVKTPQHNYKTCSLLVVCEKRDVNVRHKKKKKNWEKLSITCNTASVALGSWSCLISDQMFGWFLFHIHLINHTHSRGESLCCYTEYNSFYRGRTNCIYIINIISLVDTTDFYWASVEVVITVTVWCLQINNPMCT